MSIIAAFEGNLGQRLTVGVAADKLAEECNILAATSGLCDRFPDYEVKHSVYSWSAEEWRLHIDPVLWGRGPLAPAAQGFSENLATSLAEIRSLTPVEQDPVAAGLLNELDRGARTLQHVTKGPNMPGYADSVYKIEPPPSNPVRAAGAWAEKSPNVPVSQIVPRLGGALRRLSNAMNDATRGAAIDAISDRMRVYKQEFPVALEQDAGEAYDVLRRTVGDLLGVARRTIEEARDQPWQVQQATHDGLPGVSATAPRAALTRAGDVSAAAVEQAQRAIAVAKNGFRERGLIVQHHAAESLGSIVDVFDTRAKTLPTSLSDPYVTPSSFERPRRIGGFFKGRYESIEELMARAAAGDQPEQNLQRTSLDDLVAAATVPGYDSTQALAPTGAVDFAGIRRAVETALGAGQTASAS